MDERKINLDVTAESMLDRAGFSMLDVTRLALELREVVSDSPIHTTPVGFCRQVIRMGTRAYSHDTRTVSFREAVERSLQSRASRRGRTLAEIRQCCRRLLRNYPELAEMPVRGITSDYCREIIQGSYPTLPMQRKARRLLHGIFAFSQRHGWCAVNPTAAVDIPQVIEKPIAALTIQEVRRLLATTRRKEHLPCAAAVGLMLWAGIRPVELTRLHWEDVNVQARIITVEARHSKTGGARHVTLYPILIRWLRETAPYRLPRALIVPTSWVRRWRALRVAAGFKDWHPDTLRHTFASYHLKHFANLNTLQIDMGHADSQLLRTRYLGMRGITAEGANEFWGKSRTCSLTKSASLKQD